MLGSNNYLGLTGDERVIQGARDALDALRHRPDRLAPAQRHDRRCTSSSSASSPSGMGTEDAIVFTTGHQANVGTLGTILGPGDTVIADSGDHASILDGCLLVAGQAARRSATTASTSSSACSSARPSDGGGVLVVVDGVFSMEGDVAPLPEICDLCERFGARLMVDEAHGAGVLGARGAGATELLGVEDRVDLRMGTFSKSLASLRRLHRRPGRRHRVPAHPVARLPLHRLGRAGGRRRRARPRCASSAPTRAASCMASVLDNARYLQRRPRRARLRGRRPDAADGDDVVTPIVPVLVGDDWKAGAAVEGALRRRRLRQHRPPPRRPARRRAAAHERDGDPRPRDARPRARLLRLASKASFEARARAAPERLTRTDRAASYGPPACPILHKSERPRKRMLFASLGQTSALTDPQVVA